MRPLLLFMLLVWANLFSQTFFTPQQDSAGLRLGFSGEGVCVLDFNGDGLEDLFFTDLNGRNRLFQNLGGLKFRDAMGARLELFSSAGRPVSMVAASNGYASQNSLRQHFSLNNNAMGLPSVIYFFRLTENSRSRVRKALLVK